MRRPRRRILWGVLVPLLVILGAAVGGYLYARPLLLTGTGYAAHNACAVTLVADRADPASDLPPNPLVPYLRTSTDPQRSSSSVLGALARQQAWLTPGFGCTLADQAPRLGPATSVDPAANPFAGVNAPTPTGATSAAMGRAFGDDLAADQREALGTRAVVVVRQGAVVAERYAPGFTASTPQLGWSMAKSAANLLTGLLVRQGRLDVAADHLRPEWTDERAKISVDDLMRMTSGLRWDEQYALGTPITRMLYLEPDMAGFVAEQPLAHPVGSYQQYSSGSTNLLCSVLTERARVRADLPRRELFAPLGLTSAVWEPDATGNPVCSSYLWATPRDWAVIGQLALQDGVWQGDRLLPEGWMTQSTTARSATTEEPGYAAGWWANRAADGSLVDPLLPADAYWASGHDGQRVMVIPSADLVVVRLGFTPSTETDLRVSALVRDLLTADG